jgi:hypothetical protein
MMKRKSMQKALLSLFVMTMGIIACSSDDNKDSDSVQIKLSLVNEDSKETTTFNVGENITFQVKIMNESNEMVYLPGKSPSIGTISTEIFGVYSMDGNLIGVPYDILSENDTEIQPHQSLTLTCCWLMYPQKPSKDYQPFIVDKIKKPLKAGNYYTTFPLVIGNQTEIYKIDFKIVENEKTNNTMNEATRQLVGRWKKVPNPFMSIVYDEFIEFDEELGAKYEINKEENLLNVVESNFWLEYDWVNVQDSNTLQGHLLFKKSGNEMFPEGNDRFACSIKDNEMTLLPDMGNNYFMDPTMYFVRENQ